MKQARATLTKLSKEEASLSRTKSDLGRIDDMPEKYKTAVQETLQSVANIKDKLSILVNGANVTAACEFTTDSYTEIIAMSKEFLAASTSDEYAGKRAKFAIRLATM